ncbi:MAG: selenide,water dikinase [Kiritimatiellia bacterium]
MLGRILESNLVIPDDANLLVGNDSRDDAAVYALDETTAVISTTDFFMPIVDDPVEFGRIAAANAISDVYAMGGRPIMAIGILGWPVGKLPPEVARAVLEGGRLTCQDAGIQLAGGHSIDNPEPIFGLAVTGLVNRAQLKRNDTAKAGDVLFLTKGLGIGLLTTALKRGKLAVSDHGLASRSMQQLNKVGAALGKLDAVHAMTDVTGFGLLGHLVEVAQGSGVRAMLQLDRIPHLTDLTPYLDANTVPGGTKRNLTAYEDRVQALDLRTAYVLADPQTNGGLLVSVAPEGADEIARILGEYGLHNEPIGEMVDGDGPWVSVS